MTQAEVNKMLESHKQWLKNAADGEMEILRYSNLRNADFLNADLRSADLSHSDLSGADLRNANLYDSDLSNADLSGADLDYSCWPLWCGSLKAHVDDRIAIQLLYHTLSVVQHSPHVSDELKRTLLTSEILNIANRFHRVDECGRLTVYKEV